MVDENGAGKDRAGEDRAGRDRADRNGVGKNELGRVIVGRVTPRLCAARPGGWTNKVRARFLDVLGTTANVVHACRAVGMNRHSVYRLRRRDPEFAAQWHEAVQAGYEQLEDQLLLRAMGDAVNDDADDGDDAELRGEIGTLVADGRIGGAGAIGVDAEPVPFDPGPFDPGLALRMLGMRDQVNARGRGRAVVRATREELERALLARLELVAKRAKRAGQA